jgi:23S rRNA (cytidine1920-2'-O)/16S rRNA (cytidine1409-2'-O)-methyltransferase
MVTRPPSNGCWPRPACRLSESVATVKPAGAVRLDQALVDRGLCSSRQQAQRAILAGRVLVNGAPACKPGQRVRATDTLSLREPERYVSRGGYKLEAALAQFRIDPTGWRVLDLGASTGGFTDCLLQHGARQVYAVDVGRGQLAWKLRQDPRVVVMEGINARHLTPAMFPAPFEPVDMVVADCSFISLRLILPVAVALLRPGGRIVALVKPQFEAGRQEASRGRGVIRDPAVHRKVLEGLRSFAAETLRLRWQGVIESPLRGPAGNLEFLVLLEKPC